MGKIKDFFNLAKRFPTEEERYKKYIMLLAVLKLTTFCVLVSGVAYIAFGSSWMTFWTDLRLVLRLFLGVLLFCIFYKGRVFHFLLRTLPCLALSLFLMVMAGIFIGPLSLLAALGLSVFFNRKRFKIFGRYKNFCWYILANLVISGGVALSTKFGLLTGSFSDSLLAFFLTLGPFFLLWMLLKHEVEGGRSFVETMRVIALTGSAFLFFLFSFMTVVPVKYISGKSLFGEDDNDYLALPQA